MFENEISFSFDPFFVFLPSIASLRNVFLCYSCFFYNFERFHLNTLTLFNRMFDSLFLFLLCLERRELSLLG